MQNDIDLENKRAWYVIKVVNGMEYAAKRNIEQRIITQHMTDYIFEIFIPEITKQEKNKKGELKEVVEKIYPGYAFIDMIVTDDSWFIVRNTPLVTGFLGSSGGGAKPVPLTNEEIGNIFRQVGKKMELNIDFKVGDKVHVISGNFADQDLEVLEIDEENQMVTVAVELFGRVTSQPLRLEEVKAIK